MSKPNPKPVQTRRLVAPPLKIVSSSPTDAQTGAKDPQAETLQGRNPRWWGVYEKAVSGLAARGCLPATVVEEATEIADLSLNVAPRFVELHGVVQKVEKKSSDPQGPVTAQVSVLGQDGTFSVRVPPGEHIQPGDKVVCSVHVVR